jgi:hypothetical protein
MTIADIENFTVPPSFLAMGPLVWISTLCYLANADFFYRPMAILVLHKLFNFQVGIDASSINSNI